MNLRNHARDKPCQVRIPGVCNGDPGTTVLAHLRMAGITGVGMKSPDLLGAWCCDACHSEVDRRTRNVETEFARMCHLEGIMRTQAALIEEGCIKW